MHAQQSDWYEMRRNKIGASDAPVIMGVSPWKTPYQLWEEKLQLRPKQAQTWAMKRGTQLEDAALKEFERLTGLVMLPQMVVNHPKIDWMMATLDGIDLSSKHIVEIKCPGREDHQCALDGQIPSKYIPQLQHQMEVAGLDKSFYFSFDGQTGKVLEVEKDEKYISCLITKEHEFWQCLSNLEAPKLIDKDYVQKDDEMWMQAATSWVECQRELEQLKAKEEELRENLIFLSGKENVKGGGIKLSKIIRKGTIDYKNIPELHGVNVENYRRSPTESWRLNIER